MPGSALVSAASAAADGQADLASKVQAFVQHAKSLAADGITVADFGELLFDLLRIVVGELSSFDLPGADKKALAVQACAVLFDALADACVPAYLVPVWWCVKPAVRALLLALVGGKSVAGAPSGAIETLVPKV